MIAALYVETGGAYYGIPDVDPWDEARDARKYGGPHPVIAHPPCARWCALAGFVEHQYGYKRGEDGGCFAAALAALRAWGGVLEHPAYSAAWAAHGLIAPPRSGGWVGAGLLDPGWTCHVEQVHYGHEARKATWLYAVGADLPSLRWGRGRGTAVVSRMHVTGARMRTSPRLGGQGDPRAKATPPAFREILIAMARSARP